MIYVSRYFCKQISNAGAVKLRDHLARCSLQILIKAVFDPAVEQVIRRHTVGVAGMTSLDKIIWFADMIEPGRNYPEVEKLRRMARESSLDEMVFEGLSDSLRFVLDKGNLIHPDTVQARNEILLNRHCNDNAAV